MKKDIQSRKWHVIDQHKMATDADHAGLREKAETFNPKYYCMADEIATTGTHHTHLFLYSNSPIRFSTMKNRFPNAHIEKACGTARENRAYIRKEGKWAGTDKVKTSVPGTFEEWGELPPERPERRSDMAQIIQGIRDGMSNLEILERFPSTGYHIHDIDYIRETLRAERFSDEFRKLKVTYLYGATGTGKTWGIYKEHGAHNVYRVTNYGRSKGVSFDGYNGQDVLVFEEFNSQIPIERMLILLDIYPDRLPARYNDKVACFTKVYITSNIPLEEQFKSAQKNAPETWAAFLRRIHTVIEYRQDGSTVIHKKGGKST